MPHFCASRRPLEYHSADCRGRRGDHAVPGRLCRENSSLIVVLLAALSLFDGESLTGWLTQGDADWTVADGVLMATGTGQGFVMTEALYGDFELSLEFWVDASTNSGVFIRCKRRDRIHPDSCYELNIWDEHPRQEARTGAIVFKVMPPLSRVDTVGRWSDMSVVADGKRIEVTVNGQLTARLDDADTRAGFIALQHWESGTVKFRNLTLTPLEK